MCDYVSTTCVEAPSESEERLKKRVLNLLFSSPFSVMAFWKFGGDSCSVLYIYFVTAGLVLKYVSSN